jgi:hypothetical protein
MRETKMASSRSRGPVPGAVAWGLLGAMLASASAALAAEKFRIAAWNVDNEPDTTAQEDYLKTILTTIGTTDYVGTAFMSKRIFF